MLYFSICSKDNLLVYYLKGFCIPIGFNFSIGDTLLCRCNDVRFVFLVQRDVRLF